MTAHIRFVRNVWLTGMAFLLLGWTASASAATVTALNLEWFPGRKPMPNAEEIASHLLDTEKGFAAVAADIMIITEVCDEMALRHVVKTSIPGGSVHVLSNFRDVEQGDQRRDQQIAIISRFPAVAGWSEAWIPTSEDHRRGFAFAALRNPDSGGLIMVYGLHLKSNRSETPEEAQSNYDIRDASIRQMIEHSRRMAEMFANERIEGWIVGGDLNTNHDGHFGDHVIELLVADGYWNTWKRTPASQRPTWKGNDRFTPGTLDYVLLKGFGEPDAKLIEVAREVSDHNAVYVRFDLPGKKPPKATP